MSTFSKYKKLEKPISIERYSIDIVNKNNDIIDSELHKLDLKNESQDNLLATKEELNSEISRVTTAETTILTNLSNHILDKSNPHSVTKAQVALENVDNTSDMDKPVSTAQQDALDAYYQQSTGYTDQKIAELINGAPSTLDTLGEIVNAMQENGDVVEALDAAIGSKADAAEMESLLGTKLEKTGDIGDTTVTFTSSDTTSPSGWSNFDLFKSGPVKTLFAKISTMAKNLRFLFMCLGGFSFYPEELTQAQYDALPDDTKSIPKMIFIIKKNQG